MSLSFEEDFSFQYWSFEYKQQNSMEGLQKLYNKTIPTPLEMGTHQSQESQLTMENLIMYRCTVCGETTKQCCKSCQKVYYCSKTHQKKDWKLHKPNCFPVQITFQGSFQNRKLVATRNISRGDLIISEEPIFLTPNTRTNNGRTCLGCCRKLTPENASSCTKCKWPMCSIQCEMNNFHADNECKIFTDKGIKFPSAEGITSFQIFCQIGVLRMLILNSKDPRTWSKLSKLDNFAEQRQRTPDKMFCMKSIIQFIRMCGILDATEEKIDTAFGILRGNAFDTSECTGFIHCAPNNVRYASVIFANAIIPGPNCVPNAYYSITGRINGNYKIICIAAMNISKNEPISIPYEELFSGTFMRQDVKRCVFFHACQCYLCLDPTELGTFLSSPKCSNCKSGYFISMNPVDTNAVWKCSLCHRTMDHLKMLELLQTAKSKLHTCMNDASLTGSLKALTEVKVTLLHPNHFLVLQTELEICRRILTLFGVEEVKNFKTNVGTIMENLIELSRHLLSVANLLRPGSSRIRGRLLYCLQFGLLVKLLHDSSKDQQGHEKGTTSESMQRYKNKTAQEISAVQKEAEKILAQEPDIESEEYKMLKTLQGELKMALRTVH